MHFREKKIFIVPLQPDSTVLDLRNALAEKYKVSSSSIKLIFNSKILSDDNQLVIEVDFEENCPITCFVKPGASQAKQSPSRQTSQAQSQPSPSHLQQKEEQKQQPQPSPTPVSQPPEFQPQTISTELQPQQPQTTLYQEEDESSDANQQYKVLIDDPITSLCNLGFEREQVEKALQLCQNNVIWAQELLLSGDVSSQGLYKLVTQNYSNNYKTQIIGRNGNQVIMLATYQDEEQMQQQQKEKDEMSQFLMQIYNEMDENDKRNVNQLTDDRVNLIAAIYYYTNYGNNFESARQAIEKAKQRTVQYSYVIQ